MIVENNNRAKESTESIVVPYIKGVSYLQKFFARIANYAILEKQRNGMMNRKSSIRDVFGIKKTTTHYSDTSRRQDIVLLGNE